MTYTYQCKACKREFELANRKLAENTAPCECGASARRVISSGVNHAVKGYSERNGYSHEG